MNGYMIPIILGIVNLLIGLLLTVIGFVVKMHQKADDEHRVRIDKELDLVRQRLHDALNDISGLKAVEYLRDKK